MSAAIRRPFIGVLLLGLLPPGAVDLRAQQDLRPFARTSLEPGPTVTVGQPLVVEIEILVPTFFSGAPGYPDVELRDALVLFVFRGINFTGRIDGTTWAGQRREYHVYPQRPGFYEIPAIPVGVRYRAPNGGAGSTAVDTTSPPPVRFEAVLPPEAEGLNYFISAQGLELEHTFDPPPDSLLVGESFTRTTTVHGALSMVIPPMFADTLAGLAAYPSPPVVEDVEGFGVESTVGTRVESATYVAMEEGDYQLPALELQWWDVSAGQLRSATLAEGAFHVAANPSAAPEIPLPEDTLSAEVAEEGPPLGTTLRRFLERWGLRLIVSVLLVAVAVRLTWRHGPRLAAAREEARSRRAESEATYFRRFEQAARSGDPREAARHLTRWMDRRWGEGGPATLEAYLTRAGDPELAAEVRALSRRLYRPAESDVSAPWSGARLVERADRARRRAKRGGSRSAAVGALTALNPGASPPFSPRIEGR